MRLNQRVQNRPAKNFTLFPSDEDHLRKLDQSTRDILKLATNEGKDYETISAIAGIPIGTVKSRINRARAKIIELRAALHPEVVHAI